MQRRTACVRVECLHRPARPCRLACQRERGASKGKRRTQPIDRKKRILALLLGILCLRLLCCRLAAEASSGAHLRRRSWLSNQPSLSCAGSPFQTRRTSCSKMQLTLHFTTQPHNTVLRPLHPASCIVATMRTCDMESTVFRPRFTTPRRRTGNLSLTKSVAIKSTASVPSRLHKYPSPSFACDDCR